MCSTQSESSAKTIPIRLSSSSGKNCTGINMMTLQEYFKQCDDSYNYFKDAYERLTPEQRKAQDAKDRQQARDRSYRGYMTYLQDRGYGNEPTPNPIPTTPAPYNFVDSREMRASVNHLERRIYNLERKNK